MTPTNRLFGSIRGETVVSINDTEITTNKSRVRLYHRQSCCESVGPVKIIGDPNALIGHTITLAEEDGGDPSWAEKSAAYSHTWTSFYIEAGGQRVEIWWLGESNGYYSEDVSVKIENL